MSLSCSSNEIAQMNQLYDYQFDYKFEFSLSWVFVSYDKFKNSQHVQSHGKSSSHSIELLNWVWIDHLKYLKLKKHLFFVVDKTHLNIRIIQTIFFRTEISVVLTYFHWIFTLCYSIFILIFPDDTINMLFMLPFCFKYIIYLDINLIFNRKKN